jgi:hypothetical protein
MMLMIEEPVVGRSQRIQSPKEASTKPVPILAEQAAPSSKVGQLMAT